MCAPFKKEPEEKVLAPLCWPHLARDMVAEFLHTSPEALLAFEQEYTKASMNEATDDFFHINSRQAAEQKHTVSLDDSNPTGYSTADLEAAMELQERVIAELLAQTKVYSFDGHMSAYRRPLTLPDGFQPVQAEEVSKLPEELRPDLTGNLLKRDIGKPAFGALLYFYDQFLHAPHLNDRELAYNTFRQGLDILDLDPITYEIIGTNRNSMGHWFPQLVEACQDQNFFRVPATTIAKVPLTLLQLTRLPYESLHNVTLTIVDRWAHAAFRLEDSKEYFVKTGTYSSKFDFRNARVTGAKEVRELGEYLLYIHYQALCMAHFTVKPRPIYGASTTNEWVVREYIPDKEQNPCIYHGLPLHTEYRVFVDCDTDRVLGIAPYWEPQTMKKRFGQEGDSDSIHQIHDYIVYKAHEETLMRRFQENQEAVASHIQELLPRLDLSGQWSIDVMQNGGDFWVIDMALAEQSFFYDRYVPKELRRPSKENWLPEFPGVKTGEKES